jgi:pre-mRNA-splicing factor SYF2
MPKPLAEGTAAVAAAADAGDKGVERMVAELERTAARRAKFSRRRPVRAEAGDVDYINEDNRRFNQRVAKAYDPYTADIKDDLERGTAL